MPRKKRLALVPQYTEDVLDVSSSKHKIRLGDLKSIRPLTSNQEVFFNLYSEDHQAILAHGVAGTGKTFIALFHAFKEVLHEKSRYKKVVIIRSAVPSRDMGFLPGNEKEKIEVYIQPYQEICAELFPRLAEKAFNKLKEQEYVRFMVTSYIRGITIDNAIVVVDEAQNMTIHELDSIITRVGTNSKIIFCGDFRQTDLCRRNDLSGLKKFMDIAHRMASFRTIEFGIDDICRSPLVKEYIIARLEFDDILVAT